MPEPIDPMTELAAGAAQTHELYLAYLQAGFTEQQALKLVCALITGSVGGQG